LLEKRPLSSSHSFPKEPPSHADLCAVAARHQAFNHLHCLLLHASRDVLNLILFLLPPSSLLALRATCRFFGLSLLSRSSSLWTLFLRKLPHDSFTRNAGRSRIRPTSLQLILAKVFNEKSLLSVPDESPMNIYFENAISPKCISSSSSNLQRNRANVWTIQHFNSISKNVLVPTFGSHSRRLVYYLMFETHFSVSGVFSGSESGKGSGVSFSVPNCGQLNLAPFPKFVSNSIFTNAGGIIFITDDLEPVSSQIRSLVESSPFNCPLLVLNVNFSGDFQQSPVQIIHSLNLSASAHPVSVRNISALEDTRVVSAIEWLAAMVS
jgi:hypothetical protein